MSKTRKNPFLIPFRYTKPRYGENFFISDADSDNGTFRPISDKSRDLASRKNKAARIARKKNRKKQ